MMLSTRREFLFGSAALAATATVARWNTATAAVPGVIPTAASLPPPDPVVHAMRRTSFGIRDDELTQARAMGATAWLNAQLEPESISDPVVEVLSQTAINTEPGQLLSVFGTGVQGEGAAIFQLNTATLFRQLYSQRQLYEVMVRFWTDHFNIYHRSPYNAYLKLVDDREVIRANAMGSFPALLRASARSPAMLAYLDGISNTATAPNENYARELLELHTVGVDGGYTEADIREIARCFTGWTVGSGSSDFAQFRFDASLHDNGVKRVLGKTIRGRGGVNDGEAVLNMLASHPATARHIARKLVSHFIADDPPSNVVDAVSASYQASGGNIREMLRTLFSASEFWSSHDRKLARPQDHVIGLFRATQSDPAAFMSIAAPLLEVLLEMGHLYFNWQAPDGYPDRASYWASSTGMYQRWGFTALICEGDLSNTPMKSFGAGATTVTQMVDRMAERLLHRPLSSEDRMSFIRFAAFGQDPNAALPAWYVPMLAAMLGTAMLCSPYFMLR